MRISDWSSDVCSSDLEGVEPGRLARRYAGSRRTFRKPEIIALPSLLADARGAAHAIVADFALGIELARALGKIVTRGLARAAIDARAFACRLGGRAVGGAELDRGVIGFQRTHDLDRKSTR